jgi:hypothetical protein
MDNRNATAILAELESRKTYLGDADQAFWEGDDLAPLPEKPTGAQLKDALNMFRADMSESIGDLVALIRSQQRQIETLDRMVKDHRHLVAAGHYTPKPEF